MKRTAGFAVLVAASFSSFACVQMDTAGGKTGPPLTADKPFAAGGRIELQLESGSYQVRASRDNHVRITSDEHIGDASVAVTAEGTTARVETKATPNKFHATIEVPATADLIVHLTAGELEMDAIAGNTDINSNAGDIKVAVGNPDDYASVDAALKAGDITASAFGGSKSGLLPHFTWSGPGKRTLRANLGAGSLILRR